MNSYAALLSPHPGPLPKGEGASTTFTYRSMLKRTPSGALTASRSLYAERLSLSIIGILERILMKRAKPILIIGAICLSFVVHAQTKAINRLSPEALVADLYREHNRKHSPFFQTRSRALLYKYFEKNLADMIWKDAVRSKGEVGAIDGDPLYDAQDMEIKKFAIDKATFASGKARVNVRFENFGQQKNIVFVLVNGKTGWRISDIEYGEGRTLVGELKEG